MARLSRGAKRALLTSLTGVRWFRRPEHLLDGVAPGFIADIVNGRHALGGRAATFADLISVTAAAGKTYVDSGGVLRTAAANTPRLDWSSGVPELLLEGAATNAIRNSSMVGAATGSPGTAPANLAWRGDGSGVFRTILGIGTVNGLSYIDVRYAGTATAVIALSLDPEMATAIAGVAGQTWTYSTQIALIAGAIPAGRQLYVGLLERNAAGSVVAFGTPSITGLTAALKLVAVTRTLSDTNTAYVQPVLRCDLQAGDVVDITLRIAAPQMEQAAAASSYIPTAGTAVTRSADLCQLTPAAAAVLQNAGAAAAWRGVTPIIPAAQSRLLAATFTGSGLALLAFRPGTDNQAEVWDGSAVLRSTTGFGGGVSGFGMCSSWGPTGRGVSLNNGAISADVYSYNLAGKAISVGPVNGVGVNQILRLRQLVGWSLPGRASAAAIQAQARLAT